MGRWVSSYNEARKITEWSQKIIGLSIVRVVLDNGVVIEGVIRTFQVGNNAGRGGSWQYNGHFELETLEHVLWNIDFCDVSNICNLWDQKKDQYESAGLIKIQRASE